MYVTTSLALAASHAAGWQNWAEASGAAPSRGLVYEVTPAGRVDPDTDWRDSGGFCCCLRDHGPRAPCCFSCDSASVVRVRAEVEAAEDLITIVYKRELRAAYHVWREQEGVEWHGTVRA